MAEWLVLLLVVPAVVVPVVLFIGFAGCSFEAGRSDSPVIQSALGKNTNTIILTNH